MCIFCSLFALVHASSTRAKPSVSTMSHSSTLIELKTLEKHLHIARDASFEELFMKFATRLRNKRGIFYQQLFEDQNFIYWGKPFFKGMFFGEKRVVKELYKTSKVQLADMLPVYNEIWASTLRNAVYQAIRVYRNSQKLLKKYSSPTYEVSLQKKKAGGTLILITAQIDVFPIEKEQKAHEVSPSKQQLQQAQYKITVSTKDLSVLEIKAIH